MADLEDERRLHRYLFMKKFFKHETYAFRPFSTGPFDHLLPDTIVEILSNSFVAKWPGSSLYSSRCFSGLSNLYYCDISKGDVCYFILIEGKKRIVNEEFLMRCKSHERDQGKKPKIG